MEYLPQIGLAIVSLMLLGLGSMSMFAPTKMLGNFAVEPQGNLGLSTIRSVIGGLFIASFAFIAIGYSQAMPIWYLPVIIIMLAVAFGRIIGFVLDGFDKNAVPPTIVELIIAAILYFAFSQAVIS